MASWVKVVFREAAAKTVISPDMEDPGLGEPVAGRVVPDAQAVKLPARPMAKAPATTEFVTRFRKFLI
ncbi:hypothetical protein AAU01_01540 [Paenarthrobacter aurescens]|uniref:Uncharacterized protein n=1 Tax=Paenarthrobacter aurescens TaxID=43663 RepID=A0A4Y3NFA7_PAEAU|nr:hypothetical protein AAU01_01540 [Paenarthrobacter aurescens]